MITKSNGGVMRAELGKTAPIQMLLSGTAAGRHRRQPVAPHTGVSSTLSFDVGGTSADVAIIQTASRISARASGSATSRSTSRPCRCPRSARVADRLRGWTSSMF